MRSAGVEDGRLEEALSDVSDSCEVCARYRKAKPRPVVSLSFARNFNETVALDLKAWGKSYFLVMVDHATRYTNAVVIPNKMAGTIIKHVIQNWISLFGAPDKFLTDNGCEFNNHEFRELGEAFNIKILTTAAESPWSNGVCERQNAVIGDSVEKIVSDVGCEVAVALAWAVSARNALSNYSGYSPNQLVFGRNPALPSIFVNSPPALEPVENSSLVRENLVAMHRARENFVKAEASEKLARAMKHNIRSSAADCINNGDEVYYKRNDRREWHGPGVVIGRDGKQFLVKHGGVYVRVHECRIKDTPCRKICTNDGGTAPALDLPLTEAERKVPIERHNDGDDEPSAVRGENDCEDLEDDPVVDDVAVRGDDGNEESAEVVRESESARASLKIGLRIEGLEKQSGEYVSGTIISRAGKASGKYKNCFNIRKDQDNSVDWYNFDEDFDDWSVVADEVEMLVLFNSDDVWSAKQSEIQNWIDNEVYEEVEDVGQRFMSVRWVVTEKLKRDEKVTKARLVARGFEEDTSKLRKDSPTCSKEAVRLLISVAASCGWSCCSLDVKAAYLQGNLIERDLYLRPPPEFFVGRLWKLKKTVYGLCDAARAWYMRVKNELLMLGASVSSLDSAIFYWKNQGCLRGLICVYVDDFLWAGDKSFEDGIIKKLSDMFLIGSSEYRSFKYVGLNVVTSNLGCISVDQLQYISSLAAISISRERTGQKDSPLTDGERADFRALLGQLNWVATHTRPDIAFEVCQLSVSCRSAVIGDLLRLNKVIGQARTCNLKMFFPKLDRRSWYLECYSDASFGNLPDGGSQGGFVVFLRDAEGSRCPIFWQSRKIKRVVKSTLAAEALALLDGAEASIFIGHLLQEICSDCPIGVRCLVDNKNLVESVYSSHYVEDRRLRIDIAVLQDLIGKREIMSISWVDTRNQLADCLTKRGASAKKLNCVLRGAAEEM